MSTMYLQRCAEVATGLAQLIDQAEALHGAYFHRGYSAEGAITDEQLAQAGIARADLVAFVTLAEQLMNLRSGAIVAPAAYGITLSKLRRDI